VEHAIAARVAIVSQARRNFGRFDSKAGQLAKLPRLKEPISGNDFDLLGYDSGCFLLGCSPD
jgi:hypothetical protein